MADELQPPDVDLDIEDPAVVSYISLQVLLGIPTLDLVLRLLLLRTSEHGRAGAELYAQLLQWVEACQMASVSEARICVQLARAIWALHTKHPRDDPDFTRVPRRARQYTR
jgi:hypothetical protein